MLTGAPFHVQNYPSLDDVPHSQSVSCFRCLCVSWLRALLVVIFLSFREQVGELRTACSVHKRPGIHCHGPRAPSPVHSWSPGWQPPQISHPSSLLGLNAKPRQSGTEASSLSTSIQRKDRYFANKSCHSPPMKTPQWDDMEIFSLSISMKLFKQTTQLKPIDDS